MHLLTLLDLFTDRKTDFFTFHIRQPVESLLSYWPDVWKRYPFREVPSRTAHYWECPLGPRSTRPLYQVPVVQKLGYFTQRVNHYPTNKLSIRETDCIIQWIEIYLVDSVIHLLNRKRGANWCIGGRFFHHYQKLRESKTNYGRIKKA